MGVLSCPAPTLPDSVRMDLDARRLFKGSRVRAPHLRFFSVLHVSFHLRKAFLTGLILLHVPKKLRLHSQRWIAAPPVALLMHVGWCVYLHQVGFERPDDFVKMRVREIFPKDPVVWTRRYGVLTINSRGTSPVWVCFVSTE